MGDGVLDVIKTNRHNLEHRTSNIQHRKWKRFALPFYKTDRKPYSMFDIQLPVYLPIKGKRSLIR